MSIFPKLGRRHLPRLSLSSCALCCNTVNFGQSFTLCIFCVIRDFPEEEKLFHPWWYKKMIQGLPTLRCFALCSTWESRKMKRSSLSAAVWGIGRKPFLIKISDWTRTHLWRSIIRPPWSSPYRLSRKKWDRWSLQLTVAKSHKEVPIIQIHLQLSTILYPIRQLWSALSLSGWYKNRSR